MHLSPLRVELALVNNPNSLRSKAPPSPQIS